MKIFIDYGEQWEKAWNSHVDNWKAPEKEDFKPVAEILAKDDLRSLEELKHNPYPANIQLLCYKGSLTASDDDGEEGYANNEKDNDDGNDEYDYYYEEDDNDDKDEDYYNYDGLKDFASEKSDLDEPDSLLPCEIVDISTAGLYKVRIFHGKKRTVVETYPKKSIAIVMKPYSSDQYLEGTFRHYIEISDEIFPEQWKTL